MSLKQALTVKSCVHMALDKFFDLLKNLTGHFIPMGLLNIFGLFTPNFEWLVIYIFARLKWFCVNKTPKYPNFRLVENIHPVPCSVLPYFSFAGNGPLLTGKAKIYARGALSWGGGGI